MSPAATEIFASGGPTWAKFLYPAAKVFVKFRQRRSYRCNLVQSGGRSFLSTSTVQYNLFLFNRFSPPAVLFGIFGQLASPASSCSRPPISSTILTAPVCLPQNPKCLYFSIGTYSSSIISTELLVCGIYSGFCC